MDLNHSNPKMFLENMKLSLGSTVEDCQSSKVALETTYQCASLKKADLQKTIQKKKEEVAMYQL